MRAFWDLRTEAVSGEMTVGRIPWSMARAYAVTHLGWSSDMLDVFWRVIFALDTAYHAWMKNEYDRYRRNSAPSTPPSKPGKGRSKSKRSYAR